MSYLKTIIAFFLLLSFDSIATTVSTVVGVAPHTKIFEASLPPPHNTIRIEISETNTEIAEIKLLVNNKSIEIDNSLFPADFRNVLPSIQRSRDGADVKCSEVIVSFEYGREFNYTFSFGPPLEDETFTERLRSILKITIDSNFDLKTKLLFQKSD